MGVNVSTIKPLYISKEDQTEPINLLLIYNEETDNTHIHVSRPCRDSTTNLDTLSLINQDV